VRRGRGPRGEHSLTALLLTLDAAHEALSLGSTTPTAQAKKRWPGSSGTGGVTVAPVAVIDAFPFTMAKTSEWCSAQLKLSSYMKKYIRTFGTDTRTPLFLRPASFSLNTTPLLPGDGDGCTTSRLVPALSTGQGAVQSGHGVRE
jgi:hypothetical protein